ncbi:hypothetical protein PGT21_009417 [Puccinia graminis f. sp. tritici]|uniref:Secreted protein n=1 Tax=Puccinia graminis f. sp. tritici TaxID=56615 RepID=A0A5B0LJT8_PUCGR|nr:hypothetical protein PGT21_009417 [Puccinia graminis f. sp. tritici]
MFNFKASLVTAYVVCVITVLSYSLEPPKTRHFPPSHKPTQHSTKGVQGFCYDHNETPYKCDHCNSGADQDPHGSPCKT